MSAPLAPGSARTLPHGGLKIERFYRGTASYADRLTHDELETIHVDLGADGYLLEQTAAGKQVVVTGDSGDGKTHLIKRLRTRIETEHAAVVIADANELCDEVIVAQWHACAQSGRPFLMAINRDALAHLARASDQRGLGGVTEALRQLASIRSLDTIGDVGPPRANVVVMDLSLRDTLAPPVVHAVVERLTQDRHYENLAPDDPARLNREILRRVDVQRRLAAMLALVGRRIGHVTMRQLLAYVAFLITGGRRADQRLDAAQDPDSLCYATLAFEGGVGPLFDAVRSAFDPAFVTHPEWDAELWSSAARKLPRADASRSGSHSELVDDPMVAFRAMKRRFYFEHPHGADLMQVLPKDEDQFELLLERAGNATPALVRHLVQTVNRFCEPGHSDSERLLVRPQRPGGGEPSHRSTRRMLPLQQLRVRPVRLASWAAEWLPPRCRPERSFVLEAFRHDGVSVARLEVDRTVYLTLMDGHRGLAGSIRTEAAGRRISSFVEQCANALD